MSSMSDVIVVGGGPIGGMVARIIASNGYEVKILEEHGEIGSDKCAGFVTPRLLEIAGIGKEVILNEVKGATIHSPKGKELVIGGNRVHAVAIDRIKFDKLMIEKAIDEGAEILLGKKAVGVTIDDKILVATNDGKMDCKILVGADGVNSRVARWFDFPNPKEIIYGYQVEVSNLDLNREFVDIFIGEKVAPGFFLWIIPIGEKKARIGLCVKSGYSPRPYLENFLSKMDGTVESRTGGLIPFGPLERCYDDRVVVVGDAAGQVKATSGGGLYPGLICARHCGELVSEALEIGDPSAKKLREYQKRWEKDIGRELKLDWLIRKAFLKLDDKKFEKIFRLLDDPEIISTINRYGDIDHPSRIAFKLIKKFPRLLRFLPLMI